MPALAHAKKIPEPQDQQDIQSKPKEAGSQKRSVYTTIEKARPLGTDRGCPSRSVSDFCSSAIGFSRLNAVLRAAAGTAALRAGAFVLVPFVPNKAQPQKNESANGKWITDIVREPRNSPKAFDEVVKART